MPLDQPIAGTSWRARLALRFERRGARTVLATRTHDGPLVVQKALHPEGEAVCHAIVVHPPAGVAGGDQLLIEATVAEGAHALLTTPGAGKWYRSAGAWAAQHVQLDIAPGACIEWLPQENIVYDGARAQLHWRAALAADARLIAWDIVCLGRTGYGERFERGALRLDARLLREERVAWLERASLEADSHALASHVGLGGASVFGTMVVAAPAIDDSWLQGARQEAPASGEGAATRLGAVLVVRYRGASTEAARRYFTAVWRRLRPGVMRREAAEPRIWST
jgi:urease accessory protein